MASRRLILAVVVILAAVAGCTRSEAGQANPAGPNTSTSETASPPAGSAPGSASPTVAVPPRPRALTLDGVEPCALYTDAQLDQLSVNRVRKTTAGSAQFKGMLECVLSISGQDNEYRLTLMTKEGIGSWLTGERNVEAKLTSVAGYAAATYWFRGANGHNTADCETSVDVADGEELMVNIGNDAAHSFALEQLCQMAEKAAGFAVQTLQTLK